MDNPISLAEKLESYVVESREFIAGLKEYILEKEKIDKAFEETLKEIQITLLAAIS